MYELSVLDKNTWYHMWMQTNEKDNSKNTIKHEKYNYEYDQTFTN